MLQMKRRRIIINQYMLRANIHIITWSNRPEMPRRIINEARTTMLCHLPVAIHSRDNVTIYRCNNRNAPIHVAGDTFAFARIIGPSASCSNIVTDP